MEIRTCLMRTRLCVVVLSSLVLVVACNGQTDPTDEPGATQVFWPQLESAEPEPAAPGAAMTIIGQGGYVVTQNGGHELIDESHREFALYFDGEEIGHIACYVNRCEVEAVIPDGVEPGEHEISVEGGSVLRIQIAGD